MFKLENDRLSVSLLAPEEGTNNMERFDHSAYIYSVVLDGKYEFLTGEPGELLPHRLTGGKGLVSEIKCDELGVEAGPNAWFPKFGVGLLKNSENGGKFTFRDPYPIEPFEVEWFAGEEYAEFHTLPRECMGYALDERRSVTLKDNTITIDYKYTNVGEKALQLSEYVHNFMTIEHKPLSPAYRLDAAVKDITGKVPGHGGPAVGEGNGISWTGYSDSSIMMHFNDEDFDRSLPFFWKLSNSESSAWVSEETSFAPAHAPVWSIDHIVSCECYNEFTLQPGETIGYSRKWTFGD